jgi:hypothetical protein
LLVKKPLTMRRHVSMSKNGSLTLQCQLERKMAYFDYGAAAELFPGRQRTKMMAAVAYIRFAAAAEAIRPFLPREPKHYFLLGRLAAKRAK